MASITEMRRKNKESGGHFFDRGNSAVIAKHGNYLVVRGIGGGFVIHKFDSSSGRIEFVDNPSGSYSWQPYETREEAVNYAKKLGGK